MHAARNQHPIRPILALLAGLAWALGLAVCLRAAPAAAEPAVRDPVQVFYPRNGCLGDRIEIEIWDRSKATWKRHPVHPQVPLETCQTEDAGVLLNEIRWRCIEKPTDRSAPGWVVGLDVFDPAVTESCAVAPVLPSSGATQIHVESPPAGRPLRSDDLENSVSGSVRLQGLEGYAYDVVLAVDRSASARDADTDLLAAQLRALHEFIERIGPRLGRVRVGIVSYPNAPPGPGESTGARREIALTADRDALLKSLVRLQRRGVSGMQTFSSAFEFGLAELAGRNPGSGAREHAHKLLVIASDGRRALPFGDAADRAPDFRKRNLGLAEQVRRQGASLHLFALAGLAETPSAFLQELLERSGAAFTRVPQPALGSDYLASVSLPSVAEVLVENATTGRPARRAALDADGHFEAQVAFIGGENRLHIRARTTEDQWIERDWRVDFDDSRVVDRLRGAELERMRREQRKQLEINADQRIDTP
jgi:von Willebrand factor type A domain